MIIEHPPKLGPDEPIVGLEPYLWMHTTYGGTVGSLVIAVRDVLGKTRKDNILGRTR